MGAFAELLAAAMNTNTGGLDHHSANYVEKQVIDWFKEMLGFPASASGLLTSGCSAANLIGLAVARNAKAGFDLRREGVCAAPRKMVLYASQEIHSSVQKAVELLGLGSDALRYVPVNDAFQIDLEALKAAIAQDRQDGHLPILRRRRGGDDQHRAIDDLSALADICQQEESLAARGRRVWRVGGPGSRRQSTWWPGWSGRIRWPWTCTSGCTCPMRSAACWCGARQSTARPFP